MLLNGILEPPRTPDRLTLPLFPGLPLLVTKVSAAKGSSTHIVSSVVSLGAGVSSIENGGDPIDAGENSITVA